jgi:ABC-type Fe3+-hydroxamate transport system substrate-binding protein
MLASNTPLYQIDEKMIRTLQPHIILTQDICNVCAVDLVTVQRLAQQMHPNSPDVLSLNPLSLGDVLDDVISVGDKIGLGQEATKSRRELENRIEKAKTVANDSEFYPNVAFIEWTDPIYVGGHWTPQLIKMAGGSHPLNQAPSDITCGAGKSFPIEIEKVIESDPDFIICAPCGLQLSQSVQEAKMLLESNKDFRNLKAVTNNRFIAVDGDAYFNRPGIRLVDALEWLVYILHKDYHPFASKMCPDNFAHEYIDIHDY